MPHTCSEHILGGSPLRARISCSLLHPQHAMILSIPTLLARSRRRKPVEYDKICPSCPKHYSSQSTLSRFKHAVPAVASTGPVTVTPESSRQVTCPCLHLLCARCNLYPMQWVLGPHTRCRSRSTHGVNTLRYRAGHSPCVLDSADRPPRFPTLARSACHVSSSCARPHNADLRSRPSAGTLSPQHSAHPSLAIDALPHFVYDIYILFDACSRCRASSSRGLRCRTSLQLHLAAVCCSNMERAKTPSNCARCRARRVKPTGLPPAM